MKNLGKLTFGLLLWLCTFGLTLPAIQAKPIGGGIKLSVGVLALPQTGTAPIGQPNGTPHQTALSWIASAPVTGVTVAGYNVYRSTTAAGEAGTTAINGTSLITGTTFTDTSVVPGTTYFYVVSAQSSSGNQSGFSNEATAPIPANPANPSGCKAASQ